ncbi:E3 ubiquitin-protein ligase RNF167-like isoform X1 [Leptotrombidium deliense]|uniref:E3 ubiquitin-protein ligase RNF167-like isoform X1 n=1 Tax=Leptotrombidium deliense TaxID=299467 RepID=A0A443S449_9ACAR|nr:E3 ubiquitin-protein ligase RNF167-like isoform X1 [Leptotrombidium deliense]
MFETFLINFSFSTIFAILFISSLVLYAISFFSLCKLKKNQPRNALDFIETVTYQKADEIEVCSICGGRFDKGDYFRVFPCQHLYHEHCLDVWLMKSNNRCPLCLRMITIENKNINEVKNTEKPPMNFTKLIDV